MNRITVVTYKDIVTVIKYGASIEVTNVIYDYMDRPIEQYKTEEAKMSCYGRLSEIDFLSRIFDLKSLPSTDSRCKNAEMDIWRHTISNDDFEPYWFFDYEPFDFRSDDTKILSFLCEMFHPTVRIENESWSDFLIIFNEILKHDGYELYPKSKISGRDVYGWRLLSTTNEIEAQIINKINFEYIGQIASRAKRDIDIGDYDSALTKSRTLLEEVFCYIIEENGAVPSEKGDIGILSNQVKKLYIMHQSKEADKRINGLLSGLEKILSSITEMRNKAGDSHGAGSKRYAIQEHHARLYVNSAITYTEFILSVHLNKKLT